jgi:thiamine monophosphate kinase
MLEECGGLAGDPLEPVRGDLGNEELSQLRAFLKPSAQLELAGELRNRGVRCAIDISDGLFSDAQHLCEESGVDIVLEIDGSTFLPSVRERPLEAAAAGEDFVLLFGAGPDIDMSDMGCLPAGHACRGTGRLTVVLEGREVPVTATGYDHMEVF